MLVELPTVNAAFSLRQSILLDILGALLVHVFYNRYELNPSHSVGTLILLGGVPALSAIFLTFHFASVPHAILVSFPMFYTSLLSSIAVYRVSPLHPLSKYPGPFPAKLSKFYGLWMMSGGKNHIFHEKLHERYGPYVRVGPNELSIVDADHIREILGVGGLSKGPMWDARRSPQVDSVKGLIAIRDMQEHAHRRKPWNRAFSTASIEGYETALLKRGFQLVGELRKRSKKEEGGADVPAVNLSEWMSRFSFDFMGDMAFGGGFETMRDGVEKFPIWHAIGNGMKALALIQHLPWIVPAIYMVPGSTKNVDIFRKYSQDAAAKRKANGSYSKDIFHHLTDEAGVEKEPPTDAIVMSDATLTIVAGSDTTATVLGGLFYNLLLHPEDYIRLQKEVDENFPLAEGDGVDLSKLSKMPFLNAVINEALRIGSPANILQRGTTEDTGGRWLGANYIPKGTAIDVPIYTLFRDARYFSPAPKEFWPDRWLQFGMRKRTPKQISLSIGAGGTNAKGSMPNAAAYIPFSYGPANCAGRNLATLELRIVVALVMKHFDLRFDDGYDPRDWEEKLQDWFVMKNGPLPVRLTSRI
ncbi:hypothetical protein M0805_005452 [Coniferiporia weirii]|nr:hypothetical protein M0805_005452 [Coniferiporia weirii]